MANATFTGNELIVLPYTLPGAVTRLEIGMMAKILSLLCDAYYELKARR